jgi:uncharacterized membrane protein YkvA (DUF1232 family)
MSRLLLSLRLAQNAQHGVHLFRNRRTLFQMLRDTLTGKYKMSFITMLILALSLVYIIFPLDIIPDFIPFVGWADDGAVIYMLLKRLVKEKERYNRLKAMSRKAL